MTSYTCVACSRPMLWHRFSVPASDRLRAEWLESLGLDTQLRSDIDRKRRDRKRVFICERHFAAEDIMRTVRGHTFIADGVLPIPVDKIQVTIPGSTCVVNSQSIDDGEFKSVEMEIRPPPVRADLLISQQLLEEAEAGANEMKPPTSGEITDADEELLQYFSDGGQCDFCPVEVVCEPEKLAENCWQHLLIMHTELYINTDHHKKASLPTNSETPVNLFGRTEQHRPTIKKINFRGRRKMESQPPMSQKRSRKLVRLRNAAAVALEQLHMRRQQEAAEPESTDYARQRLIHVGETSKSSVTDVVDDVVNLVNDTGIVDSRPKPAKGAKRPIPAEILLAKGVSRKIAAKKRNTVSHNLLIGTSCRRTIPVDQWKEVLSDAKLELVGTGCRRTIPVDQWKEVLPAEFGGLRRLARLRSVTAMALEQLKLRRQQAAAIASKTKRIREWRLEQIKLRRLQALVKKKSTNRHLSSALGRAAAKQEDVEVLEASEAVDSLTAMDATGNGIETLDEPCSSSNRNRISSSLSLAAQKTASKQQILKSFFKEVDQLRRLQQGQLIQSVEANDRLSNEERRDEIDGNEKQRPKAVQRKDTRRITARRYNRVAVMTMEQRAKEQRRLSQARIRNAIDEWHRNPKQMSDLVEDGPFLQRRRICQLCQQRCFPHTLISHVYGFHMSVNHIRCPKCSFSSDYDTIKQHIKLKHPGRPVDMHMYESPVRKLEFQDLHNKCFPNLQHFKSILSLIGKEEAEQRIPLVLPENRGGNSTDVEEDTMEVKNEFVEMEEESPMVDNCTAAIGCYSEMKTEQLRNDAFEDFDEEDSVISPIVTTAIRKDEEATYK